MAWERSFSRALSLSAFATNNQIQAAERCSGECFVLVTVVRDLGSWPPMERRRISNFETREELIDACLASVHIPLFMDGRVFASAGSGASQGLRLIDGSFLPSPVSSPSAGADGGGERHYRGDLDVAARAPDAIVDHKVDPSLADEAFVQLKPGVDLVRALMDRGTRYGEADQKACQKRA